MCDNSITLGASAVPTSITTTAVDPLCGDYENYRGSCYKFYTTGMSWTDAQAACVSDGGGLVEVGDIDEQNFIAGIFIHHL